MTLHDIIEKISMNSYTQYEIRVMLEELAKSQEQQQSPFVEDGLLAIPEEHIFHGLTLNVPRDGEPTQHEKVYVIDLVHIRDGETAEEAIKRLGLKPIGE